MATHAGCAVPASARDTYIAANPLNSGNELQQINVQYRLLPSSTDPKPLPLRRSGFPALTPNPYGQPNNPMFDRYFIRRPTYPTAELIG